jgi:hypothetical protein
LIHCQSSKVRHKVISALYKHWQLVATLHQHAQPQAL